MLKIKSWPLSLTAVFLVLGILLSLQFRTQRLLASSLEAQKTTDLVTMWKNLSAKRNQLQGEIAQLQQQLFTLKTNSGQSSEAEASLTRELTRLQMNTGLAAVKGPGVTVTITGDAPLLYFDLVDLVNELWASGAEAIAVNNYRINAYSTISEENDGPRNYITVDGQRLLYPIVIKAIGDPQTLDKGLTFTGGLIDNLNNLYKVYPIVKREQDLQLPAASLPTWRYAKAAPPQAPAGDKGGK
ncbi:DUF881 domain-containing protein [Moorella sp. Hama-1]|uniref:DUF881 domain-containing protein n=1 Tax=Moorella sp. Hama-1 TaxID=2138101 RepID=UPI001379F835|nr:DUF881 domain-containing protein [Moorella sp. Hama-1]MDN5362554.1 hypothetical protein [Moorella sp. (in: firmicutes)]BCV22818.1 hypothetical protein hamaS1_28870 [Moorella sp. Hama-1]